MAEGKDHSAGNAHLRSHLRTATMAAHDLLDAAMQAASGWQTRADYARFLELQHSARAPLEDWLDSHAHDRRHGGYFGFLARDGAPPVHAGAEDVEDEGLYPHPRRIERPA